MYCWKHGEAGGAIDIDSKNIIKPVRGTVNFLILLLIVSRH